MSKNKKAKKFIGGGEFPGGHIISSTGLLRNEIRRMRMNPDLYIVKNDSLDPDRQHKLKISKDKSISGKEHEKRILGDKVAQKNKESLSSKENEYLKNPDIDHEI